MLGVHLDTTADRAIRMGMATLITRFGALRFGLPPFSGPDASVYLGSSGLFGVDGVGGCSFYAVYLCFQEIKKPISAR